jgi:hypothetical protein
MSIVTPFNRGRINPIYKAGGVNVNARLSEHDMAARAQRLVAQNSPNGPVSQPYFPAPLGIYGRSYAVCEMGEIAFRNRDYTDKEMRAVSDSVPGAFSSNVSMGAATTLNLLGDKVMPGNAGYTDADAREAIASKLQILGVVIADNRDNNESNLTLMSDGVITLTNNGRHAIPPGWVIATVPSIDSFREGTRGYADEIEGGRVTLQLEPYDASLHKHTPSRVYACWQMLAREGVDRAKEVYLYSFIMLSMHLVTSILGIVATALAVLADKKAIEIRDAGLINGLTVDSGMRNGNSTARAVIDQVFLAYGPQRHKLGGAAVDNAARARASAIGEYMYAVAEHVRVVLERVVGRALVGSVPKNDFDCHLMNPSR